MTQAEFSHIRKRLGKTQKQLAELLGTSIKAVHSYEQGWRNIPGHVERQLYFLLSRKRDAQKPKACWIIKKCSPAQKKCCPAWEFRAGTLCWFINGTICAGKIHKTWKKKMESCRTCEVLLKLLHPAESETSEQARGNE